MPSFKIDLPPHRRVAARFVGDARRLLQRAVAEIKIDYAALGQFIDRDAEHVQGCIEGTRDMSLAEFAELVWALNIDMRVDATIIPEVAEIVSIKKITWSK